MAIFTNQASLSYNGGVTNSNVVVGRITSTLSLSKSSVGETYQAGGIVTYVVTLVNSAGQDAVGLTVTDDLGAYTAAQQTLIPLQYVPDTIRCFLDGVLQTPPQVTVTNALTVTGVTVPAQGSTVLVYQAAVTPYAPLEAGAEIVNTVTLTGGPLTAPQTASDTVSVEQGPELSIAKAMEPVDVTSGDTLTYSFMIQNRGNVDAATADALTVTDTFSPILTGVTVTLNGQTAARGTGYTYDETTGLFQTVPGQITVPAATFGRAADGTVTVTPGTALLTVTGTVSA